MLMGDAVNVAARLEGISDVGGICVSRAVYEQVANKLSVRFADIGEQQVKNIPTPVHAFRVQMRFPEPEAGPATQKKPAAVRRWNSPVVVALVGVGALGIAVLAYFAAVTFVPQKPPVASADVHVPNPRMNGRPVDWCLLPSRQCGGPAADRYCEMQNMRRAITFTRHRSEDHTLILAPTHL